MFGSPIFNFIASMAGNLFNQAINRPIIEGANQRNLDRGNRGVDLIGEQLDRIPNIASESGLRELQGLPWETMFQSSGPSGADVFRQFNVQQGTAPDIDLGAYRFDPNRLMGIGAELAGGLRGDRLSPGQLFGQVDFPDFTGEARLAAALSGIGESRERQTAMATQDAVAGGLAMGQGLQELSGTALPSIERQFGLGAERAGIQARGDIEGQEQAYNLSRAQTQAGLASTEAQINAALSEAAARLQGDLSGQAESLSAGNLGQLLSARIAEAEMGQRSQESFLDRQLRAALGLSGLTDADRALEFNQQTQSGNMRMALAQAVANAMLSEGGLRMGGATNQAQILAGMQEMLPLFDLGTNQALALALQAQAARPPEQDSSWSFSTPFFGIGS